MCFFKDYNCDKHKIADKDIVCYKSVYVKNPEDDNPKEGWSICAGFPYSVGATYNEKTVLLDELDKYQTLSDGVFHSYTRLDLRYLHGMVSHNEYYWFRRSIKRFKCVMECVIPAGTPYWENLECQEYASTSIKVLRIMNPIKVLNGEER